MNIDEIKLVEIGLQAACNFRCTYCVSEKFRKWSHMVKIDVDEIISYIREYFDDNVLLSLTGGEPLLWEGLEKLVTSFPDNSFIIASNISQIDKHEWLKNPTSELKNRLCFRIGWHPNVRNDNFLDKIDIIKNAGYHYVVNYMVDANDRANNGEKQKKHMKFLNDNDINYEISPENDAGRDYATNDVSMQFVIPNYIDNRKFLRINGDGLIYDCYVGKTNGHISEHNMDLKYKDDKIYCDNCTGLKGYTKILSSWDNYDFSQLFPEKNRFMYEVLYDAFNNKIKYINSIK